MIASVYRLRHAVPRFPQTLQIQDNSAFRVCSGDQILPRAMRQTIASILAAAFVASANEARAVPSPNASSIQRSIILIEAWILKELSVVGLLLLLRLLIAAYYLLGTPAVRWSWIRPCWTMISAMTRLAASTPCNCVASRNPRTRRIWRAIQKRAAVPKPTNPLETHNGRYIHPFGWTQWSALCQDLPNDKIWWF